MEKYSARKALPFLILVCIAFFVSIFQFFLSKTNLWHNLELRTIDYRFAFRGINRKPSDKIVIIGMDEASFDAIKDPFIKWPSHISKVSKKLADNGAKVVGIDVLQEISLEDICKGQTREMQKVLLSGKIVLISFLEGGHRLRLPYGPLTAVVGEENIGLSNIIPDNDGVIRRQPIHLEDPGHRQLLCFPLLVLSNYLDEELAQGRDSVYRIGDRVIKNEKGFIRINYCGPANTFSQIPFYVVKRKADKKDDKFFRDKFQDKIVLIGRTDAAGKDLFLTPFNIVSNKKMSGIEIAANSINTVLQGSYPVPVKDIYNSLITLLLCIIISFTCYYLRLYIGFVTLISIQLTYLFIAFKVFSNFGYILDVSSPTISVFIAYSATYLFRYLTIEQKARKMRNVFGKLVSDSIENELWKENINVEPGIGMKKEKVTILFSDINNFTPLSEILSPEKLMNLLNEYFEEMVEIIFRNKGMIKQFVGDEIMVIYGALEDEPQQAFLAVKTAIEMVDRLQELGRKKNGPGFYSVKIGIHTGDMKVGFIGSSKRLEYTAVGKNVNLAARLESLNKQYNSFILISDETHSELIGLNDSIDKETFKNVHFEKLPPQKVKGLKQEITVYKVYKQGWCINEDSE